MRAGQFIQTGIRGFDREEALVKLKQLLPASVALFRADYTDLDDLKRLISSINKIYRENQAPDPYIAIDQEGGNVVRMPWLNYSPSNYFLGRVDNKKLTRLVGERTGYDLYQAGVRWNLAPVLDVLNSYNPVLLERSFGEEVDLIARHGGTYIKGLQSHGVAATAKHFPGHGGVLEDSHLTLPRDKRPLNMLMNDAYPFRVAVESGVRSLMMSHVLYEAIDNDFPASLSKAAYDLARNTFGFKGLIVTDSVDMHAIEDNFSPEEIVRHTLGNGADLLECADMHTSMEMAESVLNLDKNILEKKLERIRSFLPEPTSSYRPPESIISSFAFTGNEMLREAELDPNRPIRVYFLDANVESKVSEPFSTFESIENALLEDGFNMKFHNFEDLKNNTEKGGQIILVGRNEHIRDRMPLIMEKTEGNSTVYISTSISKDAGVVPPEMGYISAYSSKWQNVVGAIYRSMGLF